MIWGTTRVVHISLLPALRASGGPGLLPAQGDEILVLWCVWRRVPMEQTKSERTAETKVAACALPEGAGRDQVTRVDLAALSQFVVTRLVDDIVALRKVLQDLRCCFEWRYDCPFHGVAQVDQASRHLEELKDLRLRLAIVLSMQRSNGSRGVRPYRSEGRDDATR